jgi:ubiquinone/menaquinone biosynthesis C-methylase UbiE
MPKISNPDVVKEQYKTQDNLATRRSLHQKYERNKKWSHWVFENYCFFEGCRILEVGCGTGSMWEGQIETLPEGTTLDLTDFSSAMVEIVRGKFAHIANVTTRVMDVQSIDAADNSYDVVIASLVLQHVPDLTKAIAEVYRVLKPHGIFYTFTFGQNGAIRFLREKLKEFDPRLNAYQESDYPLTMQTVREPLKKKFEDVVVYRYADFLEVTDSADLVEYTLSSTAMAGFDKSRASSLQAFFDSCKDENGIIYFPREYGMFLAQKNG